MMCKIGDELSELSKGAIRFHGVRDSLKYLLCGVTFLST